jgi:hypothetical protein
LVFQNQAEGEVTPPWVGANLVPEAALRWRATIARLIDLASPGGPLEDFLFHGTTAAKAERIMAHGMEPTDVMLRDGDEAWFVSGSFWGRAIVAAGYAEDVERMDADLLDPIRLIAIRIEDLRDACRLEIDEATLDFPEERLVGMSAETLADRWGQISEGATWEDSLEIIGSLAAIHDFALPAEGFHVILHVADIETLVNGASNDESLLTVRSNP